MGEINKKYIVSFHKEITSDQIDQHIKIAESKGGKIHRRYTAVMNGFSAYLPREYYLELKDHPDIKRIDEDQEFGTC
ncbi:hypothetical protein CONCODRAFT_2731 [Conidiobolus coronatus NRRL 28638]|uniref:Inhibitor I9 domain-containing protein n=1 Tax=Conidiobolus coronatus (strain ATCC 28846 / CBS 209.66 / NRRL 28638) TaxID=796925 RepID=A0A137PGR4_CONC2|nr:hypothetical protein CONCODRAFT_2731 [Conidiobolus coronatus NRRL 28638]|eukprot:KXN74199.1 hypothetical protein CONCODRAFT_2731 [Conidiobolus coronatus NRRL 28638]